MHIITLQGYSRLLDNIEHPKTPTTTGALTRTGEVDGGYNSTRVSYLDKKRK